ncbi:CRP/FNR family transcriptional regulator, anaerobic regulatory protein [Rhizobium mongolense subsp. loessense]|uniref:CRP/FNR family transcriptional regulator, anaerobic regulatory protein n=2 Tax=Rhizobium mongolense TaxID=57676 RepID=A0A1G4U1X4_9HYPH|nr:CRP/FNR family transcriptional regulator, anaerobic regulatory protein [Rhizobium mongolense subsp. loessense]
MYAATAAQNSGRFLANTDAPDPPLTLKALFRRQALNRIEAGSTLFLEGDQAKHLYEVVEGVLRIFKIIGDGRRIITGFLYPGDLVGVSLRDRYLYSAEAVTLTRFRTFGRREFQDAVNSSPLLRPQLFDRLCDEMAAAQNQMVLLSRKGAEEKVCSFLLARLRHQQQMNPLTMVIDLPMTRLDIADYLGLTTETVSRTITKLTGSGILVPEGRHGLRILKAKTLENIAGDDDQDGDNRAARRN